MARAPATDGLQQGGHRRKESFVEIYENQKYHLVHKWIPHEARPWTDKRGKPCGEPADIEAPRGWVWSSNWKFDRTATNLSGWEYATNLQRFLVENRASRGMRFRDTARRRRWIRTMVVAEPDPVAAAAAADDLPAPPLREEDADNAARGVAQKLQGLQQCIATVQQAVSRGGGDVEFDEETRDMLKRLTGLIKQGVVQVEVEIREACTPAQASKLTRDLQRVKKAFSQVKARADRACSASQVPATSSLGPVQPPSSSGGVRSGSGEHSLAAAAAHDVHDEDEPGEGAYVHRDVMARQVMAKMVAVDEAGVMEQLIRERADDIQAITRSLAGLQNMFMDCAEIVGAQQDELMAMAANVDEAHEASQRAYEEVKVAEANQKQATCVIS